MSEGSFQEFADLIDSKFQRKPAEDYLRSVDQHMREMNHAMQRFSTDLAGVIKEGLQEGMRPSTDRLLLAIENLEKQKSENIADTLTKVLADFRSTLTSSTGTELQALGQSLSHIAITLNESADKSNNLSGKIDALVNALDSQIQKQRTSSEESVTKLHGTFERLLTQVEKSTKEQGETLTTIMNDLVGKTSHVTSGLISNCEALSNKNSSLVDGFSVLNENMMNSIKQYQDAIGSTKSLVQMTSGVTEKLTLSVDQMTSIQSKIDGALKQITDQSVLIQILQKSNVEGMEHYQSVFREVEGGLGKILQQLADNLQRYSDLTKHGLENYLKQYDDALSGATTKLSSTVNDLDETLEKLTDILEPVKASGE